MRCDWLSFVCCICNFITQISACLRKKKLHLSGNSCLRIPYYYQTMSSDIASTKKKQTPMMTKPPLMSVDEKKSFKVPLPPPSTDDKNRNNSISSHTTTTITTPPTNKTYNNPISQLQNSWNATNSIGGKVCLILFYTVILGKLTWAMKDLISPTIGWECFITDLSPYANEIVTMLTRNLAVLSIGYYILAGYIGSKSISNVIFAFVIHASYSWVIFITNPIAESSYAPNCTTEVDTLILVTQLFFWTSLMAVNFAVVEYWSKIW